MLSDSVLARFDERERRLIAANNLYLARVIACRRLRAEGYTLRQIGSVMEVSHEWVRQLLQVTLEPPEETSVKS